MKSSDKRLKEKYSELVSLIIKHGDKFPKKHGNWMRLYLAPQLFLTLDTWNKSARLHDGNCIYSYWNGFVGGESVWLGIDWGGFDCKARYNELMQIIDYAESRLCINGKHHKWHLFHARTKQRGYIDEISTRENSGSIDYRCISNQFQGTRYWVY